ncbi:kinesin-like protein KIF25 isoform X2 [Patella vulgata]|nr:kinesin-like protein KIF25 isoform X2 [Patella vulgata]
MSQLQTALKDITDRHNKEKKRRQGLHNLLMELRGNIRVHCRLRPLMEFDCGTEDLATLGKPGSKSEVVAHCYDDENICVKTSKHNKVFEYERVFNPTEDQPVVFDEVQPMLTSLLDGYNVCIMAYGQTGSGKTHTMLGSHNNDDYNPCETMHPDEGVIPRATRELFRLIEEKPVGSHTIEVSVVEIYNNDIKDLLSKSSTTKHELVTGSDGLLNLPTITSKPVSTVYDVMSLVQRGLRTRSESATLVHDHSSRSHLIVTLTVTSVAPSFFTVSKTDNDNLQSVKKTGGRPQSQPNLWSGDQSTNQTAVIKTKLQLVDLAGSECVGMSGVKGAALREASHINKSLSALADVLGALAEHRTHIPYRNSRLTHFLQDSIGGDSKLLVLLCVSPAARYTSESLQCLGFGQRARQVQRGPAKRRLPTYDQNSPRPKSATAISSSKI